MNRLVIRTLQLVVGAIFPSGLPFVTRSYTSLRLGCLLIENILDSGSLAYPA